MITYAQRKLIAAALLTGASVVSRTEVVEASACCTAIYEICSALCYGSVAQCDMSQAGSNWYEADCHCAELQHHHFYYVCS